MSESRSGGDVGISMQTNYQSKVVAPRNPTLCRGPKAEQKFTPSTFLKEMSLDTQQKLYNTREMYIPKIIALSDMSETTLQTTSKVEIDEPLFQPYPSDIVFQKFEPFKTYDVPLLLRNNDKVARAVKVTQVDTPYFKIIAPPNAAHKVAPGVAIVYKIQFIPEEQRDYTHEIIIATEREKFLIPIRAIGSRAILDFPDEVTFPTTAVKSTNSKVLFVRNVGTREARFVLQANKPYYVSPENGILPVGESMQVTVDFKPTVNGEIKDEMIVAYDTGEKIYVHLYGVSQDINVRLDKKSVNFENTHITMTNQRTIKINNYSDQLVHYQWKQYSTEREEEQQKLKQLHAISDDEINAIQKLNASTQETTVPFDYTVLIQRTFINHRRQLTNETYLFNDQTFRIEPLEGDIWPNSFIEIQILFKPDVAQLYNRTAWLDLVGREQRLPLQLCGTGDGPKLSASFETLEIGCVFVGSTHMYEVILANKGYIDAPYHIDPIETKFGRCFQLEPSHGVIPVDNYQAIQITFRSDQLGEFKESVLFQIDGNLKPLVVEISGSVIGPTFHFDQPSLKFGLVSYGFQSTLGFHLYNTSLVQMPFHLKIAHEYSKSRANNDSDTDSEDDDDNNVHREFHIRPSKGIIPPQSDMKIYVDFTPKSVQKYDTLLNVDIEGVGKNVFSLPVTAKSTVPRITLRDDLIDLGRCFINNPYERHVHLQNPTSLPMRYQFIFPKTGCLEFRTMDAEGTIEPNSTKDVELIITVKRLGDITEKIEINRVGVRDTTLELQITTTGTGPVLFIEPNELKWGTIPVLEENEQILVLSNESPIPAIFYCEFDKKQSQFKCEPQNGVVDPKSTLELKVTAYLNDRMKFNEQLTIHVENSSSRIIPLSANGTGALIVSDIKIFPHLDLGSKFVGTPITQKIQFTNRGRRQLAVHFIHASDQTSAYNIRKSKKELEKDAEKALERIFRIEPERLEFLPGETKTLTISGYSSKSKFIEENYTCLAIIGRSTGRDKLLSLNIQCEFIEPLMSFSKTDLNFRVENDGQTDVKPIEKDLTFSNISAIDLNAYLSVKYPFLLEEPDKMLLDEDQQDSQQVQQSKLELSIMPNDNSIYENGNSIVIPNGYVLTKRLKILTGMSYVERIYFDPNANTKEISWKVDDKLTFTYSEHSFTNTINLHGEVHYPNLLIEHKEINFGCILNGTEVTRYISVVNTSPLPVKYLWAFVIEPEKNLTIVPQPQSITKSQDVDENSLQIQSEPWPTQQEPIDDQQSTDIMKYATSIPKLEEIFDISPFFGTLQPGEVEKTAIRFYGHPGIIVNVKAICQVENGPVYELLLNGQASYMAYKLDTHELDFGDVHFDKTATKTISITNESCTPIDFRFIYPDMEHHPVTISKVPLTNMNDRSLLRSVSNLSSMNMLKDPAKIEIIPESGVCEQYSTNTIQIKFTPNIPEQFYRTLYLQVGHFQPDLIHLIGRGMFCRLQLDLPRYIDETNDEQQQLFEDARKQANPPHSLDQPPSIVIDDMRLDLTEDKPDSERSVLSMSIDRRQPSATTKEEDLQSAEVQRQFDILVVQKFVINNEQRQSMENLPTMEDEQKVKKNESDKIRVTGAALDHLTSEQIIADEEESIASTSTHEHESVGHRDSNRQLFKNRTIADNHMSVSNLGLSASLHSSTASLIKQHRNKIILPDYLIDFGYVILGTVRDKQFHIKNPTDSSITFHLDRSYLNKSGFSFDCDHVKNLPSNETIVLTVTFDPRGANLGLGEVECRVPVEVSNGPAFRLRLKANVTMPDLHVSNDTLDFGIVKCGECKIATIQLKNPKEIRCEWIAAYPGEDMQERPSKAITRSYRRTTSSTKKKQITPRIFEVLPSNGVLPAQQRVNIQIKFMPTEEQNYENRVILRINQSSQRIMIICRGSGLEPNIVIGQIKENQFIPTTSIIFNPILTHSQGDEQDIVIKNTCPFPIEIYNLEFDKQFLEEEKILRLLPGYDEYNNILLPTRPAGDKLPAELQKFYDDVIKRVEEERLTKEKEDDTTKKLDEISTVEQQFGVEQTPSENLSSLGIGDRDLKVQSDRDTTVTTTGTALNTNAGLSKTIDDYGKSEFEWGDDKNEGLLKRTAEKLINFDMTPVAQALARHLGIDLSTDGAQARNRRGVAIIVHGPPCSGKTTIAKELSQRYDCALLNLDDIITEAINSPNRSEAATRAYQLCRDAMEKHLEEQKLAEIDSEHVAAQSGAHPKKGQEKKKKTEVDLTAQIASVEPQHLTSPVSTKFKIRKFDDENSEEELMTFVLTEDIFVEIIATRLQRPDCARGIIFDGLDTQFLQNTVQTTISLLKAINNRSYMFAILTNFSYAKYKEAQTKADEMKRLEELAREQNEKEFIEEMNEDEYDALPDEEKQRIDLKRLQRKKERLQREQKEKEEQARLAQERLLQAETQKKKKPGPGGKPTLAVGGDKGATAKTSARPQLPSARPTLTDRPGTRNEGSDEAEKKKVIKTELKSAKEVIKEEESVILKIADPEEDKKKEKDRELQIKFKTFEFYRNDVVNVLDLWDRTKGMTKSPPTPTNQLEDEQAMAGAKKGVQKKDRGKKGDTKEKEKTDRAEDVQSSLNQAQQPSSITPTNIDENGQLLKDEKKVPEEIVNVPIINVDTPIDYSPNSPLPSEVLDSVHRKLPNLDQILDGMGLGPKGPPIPKPFEFAVVPFPVPRKNPPCAEYGQYFFVATSENDPNIYADEKLSSKTPEPSGDDDHKDTGTGPKGRRSRGERETTTAGKRKTSGGPGASVDKSGSRARDGKGGRASGKQSPTTHSHDGLDGTSDASGDKLMPKIARFRWIIPANGDIHVRMRFVSSEVGQFDQTITFEVVGTRRNYKIFCRGICTFPNISREPRIVFPNRQKSKKLNEIVHKKFILSSEQYDFGPLVLGKDTNKIRAGIYPSNLESITISNTSPMDADILFCFLNEVEVSKVAFFIEPTEMVLKPGELRTLKIMANPPREGHFEESLVCCIKENPEPIIYKLCCDGCTPDLIVEPNVFDFGQVLLYRKESRIVRLKNQKLIPVRWRLSGIGQDGIGQEFSTKTDTGVVEPLTTYDLQLNYYASRPRTPQSQKAKMQLKLEISDVEGMPGAIRTVNLPVFVEPYDIVLDMTFQKGNDRGIDFGNVRVNQEAKQICTLKNKGKREIRYRFELIPDPKTSIDASKYFEIVPKQGTLPAVADRNAQATSVTIIFKPTSEINLRDAEMIVVSVINVASPPKIDEKPLGKDLASTAHVATSQSTLKGGTSELGRGTAVPPVPPVPVAPPIEEEVARIRLKVSAKATYSKFAIIPSQEVNFGPIPFGVTRRLEKFIIENRGEFDFKYVLSKYIRETSPQKMNIKDSKKLSPPNRAESALSAKTRKVESIRDVPTQGRLQVGPFILTPAFGMLLQGGNTTVNIEYSPDADTAKKYEEEILIDVADKNPSEYPNGIIYKLRAELIVPQIDTTDVGSIFEEHRIVKNLSSFQHQNELMNGGVYGEDERRFVFRNVIVGRTSKARFKIMNTQKVAVDVVFGLRSASKSQKIPDVFEIDQHRIQIPPYSSHHVTVSFTPIAMQSYSIFFEANIEGLPKTKENRTQNLSFELFGEGNLPRISILKPNIRNKKAQCIMMFKKLLIGRQATQQLCLVNDGLLPAKLDFYLHDVENVYSLQPSPENERPESLVINDPTKKATIASAIFEIGQKIVLDVVFKPKQVQRYEGVLRLVVVDNQYEDTVVQLIGESYLDDITLDNIHSLAVQNEPSEEAVIDEDAPVPLSNLINFGDVHLNDSRQILFSITNHNSKDSIRFEWPEHPQLTFSPRIGHLHSNCTKDIHVNFKTTKPVQLIKEKLLCTLTKITFDRPINEVPDWDDRMRSIKWSDVPQQQTTTTDSINLSEQFATSRTRPARQKTIEQELEPINQRVDDQQRSVDLHVSAIADYCRYKCSEHEIRYLDTAMLQTRVQEVTITNRGKVQLNYAWKIQMEDNQRPFTPLIERDPPTPEPTSEGGGRKTAGIGGQRGVTRTGTSSAQSFDSNIDAGSSIKLAKDKDASKSKEALRASKESAAKSRSSSIREEKSKITRSNLQTDNLIEEKEGGSEPFFTETSNLEPSSVMPQRIDSPTSTIHPQSIMSEVGYVPFQVEPDSGTIAIGSSQIFKIKFSPLDVNDYQARLTCCIPNLESSKAGPVVAVRGRSILPFCHFELDESDYITSGRRRTDLPGLNMAPPGTMIDRNTRIIEFKSVGVGSKINKSFNVLNPTDTDYSYRWICEDPLDLTKQPTFICRATQGKIASGKGTIMSFDFMPRQFGLCESFYRFEIPHHSLSVPFLLVGNVSEPNVLLDRSHVSFHPQIIGHYCEETIYMINKEDRSFSYDFLDQSLIEGTTTGDLTVEPKSGQIQAQARQPIRLIFRPTQNRSYLYNLQCKIDSSIKQPLTLNVKGEGFSNLCSLQCEVADGSKIELSSVGMNELRFDSIVLNEISSRTFEIINRGKYSFDYEWTFSNNENDDNLFLLTPMTGNVQCSQRTNCLLEFRPKTKEHRFVQRQLQMKVVNGPTYQICLVGHSTVPNVQFSFLNYDFGPCFLYKAGMPEYSVELEISNQDMKDHSIECLYQNTSHLMCDYKTNLLQSKEANKCLITFYPREYKQYQEQIQFEIDGLTLINVSVTGEGVEFKVEVADSKQKIVNLGALQSGKTVTKDVSIINRSRAPLNNCLLSLSNQYLYTHPNVLQIQPTMPLSLRAKSGTATVQVKFSPKSRIPSFSEQVYLKYGEFDVPMFAVKGCCQGYDIQLDTDSIPFGAVVKECSITRKLVMSNRGDIGSRYQWNTSQIKDKPFQISPTNGYISPGMEITFDLTFHPKEIKQDLRCDKFECTLENCKPLQVTLCGSCVEVQPIREPIVISTPVRSKETGRPITIKNPTNTLWTLTPVISGEYFSGPETVIVEPQSTRNYEVTYLPLSEGKHTGTMFFPLPDGNGLLYNLIGNAEPPKQSGKIMREIPCKTQYVELLSVENWLKKPQRFRCTIETVKQDRQDANTVIKGLEYIDVAPRSKRDYKLNFYAYKECVQQIKVTFKNEQSQEYIWFDITFKCTIDKKNSAVGTIDITTSVRQQTTYDIQLDNPLQQKVTFQGTCNNPDILIPPDTVSVPANSQGIFNFTYMPLKSGKYESRLEITCAELGLYTYILNLNALPAKPERPLYFKTHLGSSQTLVAKFMSYARSKTDYICKIDHPDFIVDRTVTAAPGSSPSNMEVNVDVTYEPSQLGEIRANLTISSTVGSDYVFPLYATGETPKPQGPITIRAGSNVTVTFKNVFAQTLTYTFNVDNPLFHVHKTTELIQARKSHRIVVGFDGSDTPQKADVMAKLVVSCPKSAGMNTSVQWVYYLKGITP